jgi:hypothetical protein
MTSGRSPPERRYLSEHSMAQLAEKTTKEVAKPELMTA